MDSKPVTHSQPLSPFLFAAVKGMAIVRIGIGAASFFAPQTTCASHGYHVPPAFSLLVRMMGHREAINGELLFTALGSDSADGGRRAIRRALVVGLLADALDICSVLYGFPHGEVDNLTAGVLCTAASATITLAAIAIRSLQ
ncbi:DUF4267 domain-containing protein [Microdochium nivale]|nr:DUF4267 domain-containing protein [Microdochium nivale]